MMKVQPMTQGAMRFQIGRVLVNHGRSALSGAGLTAAGLATMLSYGKTWISWIGSHGLSDGAESGSRWSSGSCLVAHGEQSAAARFRRESDRLRNSQAGG